MKRWRDELKDKEKIKQKDTTFLQNICCPTIHEIALSSWWLQPLGKLQAFLAEMEQ